MVSAIRGPLAAVFDLDGTVIDSRRAMTSAIRVGCAAVGVAVGERADLGWAIGPKIEDSLRVLVGEVLMTEAREAFRREYRRSGPSLTQPNPGVAEALRSLKATGCRLAIATYKPEPLAEMILGSVGLYELFDVVVGRRLDAEDARPKARLLETALRRLRLNAPDAVYFGDHDEDEAAAREAGVWFVRYQPGTDWRRIVKGLGLSHVTETGDTGDGRNAP